MPVNDLGDEAAAAIFVGKDFVFRSKVVIWSQILSSLHLQSYCLLKVAAGNRFPQQRPAAATLGQPAGRVEADKKTFLLLRLDNDEKQCLLLPSHSRKRKSEEFKF